MLAETITVTLPVPVVRKLQKAAELTYRSVDDVLASTIDAALIAPAGLPVVLAEELAAMHLLSDDALWASVQPSMSAAEQTRLRQLNHVGGLQSLSVTETTEKLSLLNAYHRSVLRRAQALAILKQRGHTINPNHLIVTPSNDDIFDSKSITRASS